MTRRDQIETLYSLSLNLSQIKQIEEYMQYRNVPIDTKKRISNYFEHKYHQGRFFDETEIMSVIGKPLRAVSFYHQYIIVTLTSYCETNNTVQFNCNLVNPTSPFLMHFI